MVKTNTFNGMPLPDIVLEHEDGECELLRRFGYEDFFGRPVTLVRSEEWRYTKIAAGNLYVYLLNSPRANFDLSSPPRFARGRPLSTPHSPLCPPQADTHSFVERIY